MLLPRWMLLALCVCAVLAVAATAVPVTSLAARLSAGQQQLQSDSGAPAFDAAMGGAANADASHASTAAEDELDAALALDGVGGGGSGSDSGAPHTPVEHDVGMYIQWANYVRRTASLLQQEAVVKAQTHAGDAAALGASVRATEPEADDREGRPVLNRPDIINHDQSEYKGTPVGSPKPWDWHAGVEGFRPTAGYFMQDPGCDRLIRIWFDTCAFVDASDSVFHHTPDKPFPTGAVDDQVSTAKYIGNLLKQDFESEPRSHSAKQNVGHFPNGEVHEVPDNGAPDEDAEKAWEFEG